MNVGDYVRTHYGRISKIEMIDEDDKSLIVCHHGYIDTIDIIKSSPKLRSVLQEDDFVNGERITRVIPEDICGDEILDYQHIFIGDKEIYEEDIKSVLTHEQFERMEYKL